MDCRVKPGNDGGVCINFIGPCRTVLAGFPILTLASFAQHITWINRIAKCRLGGQATRANFRASGMVARVPPV
jgi:hypothetical protein